MKKGFRARVIEAAQELFPLVDFREDPDEENIIFAGEIKLGLQNMRAKLALDEHTDDEFRELVRKHFSPALVRDAPSLDEISLEEIRSQLFLQIMPAEYRNAAKLPLVSFPFVSGLRVGIVADFPESYLYVRKEDLERWKIEDEEAHDIARNNLEDASRELGIQTAGEGNDIFLMISARDGYDAARILLPGLQEFIGSQLGETFRFGIPNRDFLICWQIDCSESHHKQLRGQIIKDHSERPYPLSPSLFVRNAEGNFHEQG
jgi:hypothetical protein